MQRDLTGEIIVAAVAVLIIVLGLVLGILLSLPAGANRESVELIQSTATAMIVTEVADSMTTNVTTLEPVTETAIMQPTESATETATERPTATETPTDLPTATETATDLPTATETATELPTATETPTDRPTATETPTDLPTATETPTELPTATETPTELPTATNTPTELPTATNTPTELPTATETPTDRPTATETPTERPTATETPTELPTATETPTERPTATNTPTERPTATETNTLTPTPTPTLTPSPEVTSTAVVIATATEPSCYRPAGWGVYIVRSGDTLFKIAQTTGSTVSELQRVNCIGDIDRIFTGTRLYVPNFGANDSENGGSLDEWNYGPIGCSNAEIAQISNIDTLQRVGTSFYMTGTAYLEEFGHYALEIQSDSTGEIYFWSESKSPVKNGILGGIRTDGFDAGIYWVRLVVMYPRGDAPPENICAIPVYFP